LATSTAATVVAKGGVRQLLPLLPTAGNLPRFVRCQRGLRADTIILSHWYLNPLKAAALGAKMPVSFGLTVQSSEWDPDVYVSSCAPQSSTTCQQAELKGTPAAGHGGGQLGGSTGASGVTLSATATKKKDGCYTAAARVQDMPDGYARKVYDVVLQEQVRSAGNFNSSNFNSSLVSVATNRNLDGRRSRRHLHP
jgi:hypothetical protein